VQCLVRGLYLYFSAFEEKIGKIASKLAAAQSNPFSQSTSPGDPRATLLTVRLSEPHVLIEATIQRDCARWASRDTRQANSQSVPSFDARLLSQVQSEPFSVCYSAVTDCYSWCCTHAGTLVSLKLLKVRVKLKLVPLQTRLASSMWALHCFHCFWAAWANYFTPITSELQLRSVFLLNSSTRLRTEPTVSIICKPVTTTRRVTWVVFSNTDENQHTTSSAAAGAFPLWPAGVGLAGQLFTMAIVKYCYNFSFSCRFAVRLRSIFGSWDQRTLSFFISFSSPLMSSHRLDLLEYVYSSGVNRSMNKLHPGQLSLGNSNCHTPCIA